MKGLFKLAIAASVIASATADVHHHQHRHLHAKKAEKRAIVTAYVEGPTEVAYVDQNGKPVAVADAQACIDGGDCKVVGSTTPTFSPPPPPPPPATTSVQVAAQFFEQKTSSSSSSSAPEPTTAAPSSSAPPQSSGGDSSSGAETGATGLDAEFPSGKVRCSEGPWKYGAVQEKHINLQGWLSFQTPSNKQWIKGMSIATIDQPISGNCPPNTFASYSCPPGYTKTQWPVDSQGATGQSIGGLWCNSEGYLELTNPNFKTLCMPGAGGVSVRNELDEETCLCQTNYPGDEKMSIPFCPAPGQSITLTNLDASTAYKWQGKYTSGQFYANPKGLGVDEACTWVSPSHPDSAGNWAPVNVGAGKDIHGTTYLSIFANLPTSHAKLDYTIEIEGDITAPCWVRNNQYYGGGNGCTTAIKAGGKATIVFKK